MDSKIAQDSLPSDSVAAAAETLAARVRIVLVGPQHPGNIGAAARAMKNMGLHDLALVAARKFPHAEATTRAAGAADLLEQARVCSTLEQAVAGCGRVAATTARSRYISQPVFTPREWAEHHAARPLGGRIALLFGRERVGLSNEELDLCQEIVSVPINPDYPSLNLAQAVQLLCYELRLTQPQAAATETHLPADQAEMERFYEHLQRTLVDIQFLNPDKPRLLMRRLRVLFSRAAPNANEMNILRGILAAVERSRSRSRES